MHVTSAYKRVDCVTCIYSHGFLSYLGKSKGTVKYKFLVSNTRMVYLSSLCVLNGNMEWGRIG